MPVVYIVDMSMEYNEVFKEDHTFDQNKSKIRHTFDKYSQDSIDIEENPLARMHPSRSDDREEFQPMDINTSIQTHKDSYVSYQNDFVFTL